MTRIKFFLDSARAQLPQTTLARWASISFSFSVVSCLVSLSASQAFLAAAAACYAAHLLRGLPKVNFPPIKLPLAFFCLGTIVSIAWAPNTTVGWFAVRKLVLFLILLLAVNLIASGEHLEWLFQTLFFAAALAGLVGAAQFVLQYRAVRALHPGRIYYEMTSERITGFMGHWMNFGAQLMLVFCVLVAYLLLGPARKKFWWAVLATVATAIILNFTRGVWLGCFVATVYLVARWRPRGLWALPVLLLAGYLAAPSLVQRRVEILRHPSTDPALSIRFEMWQVALRMIQKHPWVGVGPNNIEQVYGLYLPTGKSPEPGYHGHLHNNFLQFGAERGLPTLAAWMWLMGALGWHFLRIRRNLVRGRWVADAAFAAWLALLVEGCFEFSFGTSPVLMVYLFIASSPFVAERVEQSSGRRPAAEG